VREVWIDGRIYRGPIEEPKKPKADASDETIAKKETPSADAKKPDRREELREAQRKRIARSPLEGRGPITNPPSVLIRNATVWTSSAQSVLTNAQVLIHGGKIQQVGSFKAEIGPNTLVIEGEGKHVSAGLIDAHSHAAILGQVNESSLPSTAMVRISDVVNSETA
jgi:hypothetical protein